MKKRPAKTVLLIESNPAESRLIRKMFKHQGSYVFILIHVDSMEGAEKYLAEHPIDVILLDVALPGAQGLETIRHTLAAARNSSLVLLSSPNDEPIAMQAMREGVQDYLLKGHIEPRGLMRVLHNAVERKAVEQALFNEKLRNLAEQITNLAERDALTGLPNRLLLSERLDHAITRAARNKGLIAVLFVDLDGFKHINDSLGHSAGDKLLQSVAKRLLDSIRSPDTVSRQGGDEFIVLLQDVQQAEDVSNAAGRIIKAVGETHSIDRHDVHVTASIGVSIYPADGRDAAKLIENADTAMYRAKESGRQSYRFFEPEMNARAVQRQSIEKDLRQALKRREFVLFYQPRIDLRTGAIAGAEALLRWLHPTRGLVLPAQFISVAEDSGLILPIGAWVLREACTQARAWADAGLFLKNMAVNISALQFRNVSFLEDLAAILHATGLDAKFLNIEMTERVVMERTDLATPILQVLRNRGVRVSVDDFGTGLSSLSQLRKLPLDALHIDRSFVRQITASPVDTAVISAIVAMGHSLGLRIVAEGIETAEEAAFLKSQECDEAQGFYFGRPMPAGEFSTLLENHVA
jgi:diguanylate cyclase (GGDEF)-like protein